VRLLSVVARLPACHTGDMAGITGPTALSPELRASSAERWSRCSSPAAVRCSGLRDPWRQHAQLRPAGAIAVTDGGVPSRLQQSAETIRNFREHTFAEHETDVVLV
jgi:hypothetical protein